MHPDTTQSTRDKSERTSITNLTPPTLIKYKVQKDPPLQVYADFEAVTDEDGKQTPILVCFETDESDETVVCEGPNCTGELFEKLDAFRNDQDGKPREVIVIFHNLKGYDGMFLLQYCYDNQREVTDQLPVGAKILSFKSHHLTFKDSLCFLPFPLSNFPATFGITELCKGFFPHKFNTMENQSYTGSMPPRDTYDPDGMSAKKKAEFEQWYQEKVDADYHFVLQDEMKAYCESDVKLLKAGCKKFRQEFKQHANFDPFEKCVTIASACNRYWRKKLVPQNTIASQPPRGWFGARTNQSAKALKWLAWQEHLLRQQPNISQAPGDRIRSVVNEGEMRVGPQRVLVDGYDETTNTVYEFHGCLWHACPKCFKNNRHSHLHRPSRSHFVRSARPHQGEDQNLARSRVPRHRKVGMRLGSRCRNGSRLETLSRRRLRVCGPLTTSRRLLRR